MCAVTYIPVGDTLLLTSSRDENPERTVARDPHFVDGPCGRLLFPRDGKEGGTWFVMHEKGHVLILLNGAWKKHVPLPPYRKSRGLVLLELAQGDNPLLSFRHTDLSGIEPFTLILVLERNLFECRWDGSVKFERQMDKNKPWIWSSVTLYDEAGVQRREKWFEQFLLENPDPDQDAILEFHQSAGAGDPHSGLLMNRGRLMQTVSITSLFFTPRVARMKYLALPGKQTTCQEVFFTKAREVFL
ncbi:NRDE family protein [Flavitalea flava]